jgi:hypothetical protein
MTRDASYQLRKFILLWLWVAGEAVTTIPKFKNILAVQNKMQTKTVRNNYKKCFTCGVGRNVAPLTHFPRLPAPRPPEPRPPRPPSKLPCFEPCGKGFPVPEPREPPRVKPRRLGGRLEAGQSRDGLTGLRSGLVGRVGRGGVCPRTLLGRLRLRREDCGGLPKWPSMRARAILV